jgi:hypothetical protein
MFVTFLSNEKAVIVPAASVHFTFVGAEGFTAHVGGVKYHPIDPRSIALHEAGALTKVTLEMAEKSRLAGFTPA